jgi:hypothetical protein
MSLCLFVPLHYMMICSFSWWPFSIPATWCDSFISRIYLRLKLTFPPKVLGFIEYISFFVTKEELAGETISVKLIHFALDNLKI